MHDIILLHGMGDEDPQTTEYDPFIANVQALLRARGVQADSVKFHCIDYSHIAGGDQWAVFNKSFPKFAGSRPSPFQIIPFLRYFMTFYVGDVIAYSSPDGENSIREYVFGKLDEIIRTKAPSFSIIAHSLGSVVAYDYLFNLFGKDGNQARKVGEGVTPRLVSFFTMGSPIGLFLLRKKGLLEPGILKKNPIGLDKTRGCWCNLYDKQDVIAYPLQGLFPEVAKDVVVQTGNLIVNSHMNYWLKKDVARKIVGRLLKPAG